VAEHLACNERAQVRLLPSPSSLRSVNGSTRPLYGRGAGSNPAGGSHARSSVEEHCSDTAEALVRFQPGVLASLAGDGSRPAKPGSAVASRRYAPSSERAVWPNTVPLAYGHTATRQETETLADVAQKEEHRAANPATPVRPRSSALGPWCNRKHRELQPRWSGFESWRTCRRGPERLGYLVRAAARRPLRFDSASRSHTTTATNLLLRAGSVPVIDYESTGRGFESRPERSCSGSSVGRAVPGRKHKTAADHDTTAESIGLRAGARRLSG
jgi:hypothetical protein